jgi:hypothetical protein
MRSTFISLCVAARASTGSVATGARLSAGYAATLLAPHPVARSRRPALLAAGVAWCWAHLGVLLSLVAPELIFRIEGLSTNRAGVVGRRRIHIFLHRYSSLSLGLINGAPFLVPYPCLLQPIVCCDTRGVSPSCGVRAQGPSAAESRVLRAGPKMSSEARWFLMEALKDPDVTVDAGAAALLTGNLVPTRPATEASPSGWGSASSMTDFGFLSKTKVLGSIPLTRTCEAVDLGVRLIEALASDWGVEKDERARRSGSRSSCVRWRQPPTQAQQSGIPTSPARFAGSSYGPHSEGSLGATWPRLGRGALNELPLDLPLAGDAPRLSSLLPLDARSRPGGLGIPNRLGPRLGLGTLDQHGHPGRN